MAHGNRTRSAQIATRRIALQGHRTILLCHFFIPTRFFIFRIARWQCFWFSNWREKFIFWWFECGLRLVTSNTDSIRRHCLVGGLVTVGITYSVSQTLERRCGGFTTEAFSTWHCSVATGAASHCLELAWHKNSRLVRLSRHRTCVGGW